ncbi:acyl-CoA dehydrogenase family protein [Cryptosporangium sp. NPDC051539]|uniref:acyl-CoA dehydrogenase family protein n=1 Tax=Cryptosporangium sp. NPDC051539 TaxID=3363962 RepID=UPI00378F8A85
MTRPATNWFGHSLDDDEASIVSVLSDFATAAPTPPASDDETAVAKARRSLAEFGFWTPGTAEEHGGGGAGYRLTTIALERLGRYWPALALASAQAHTAVDVLAPLPAFADLVADVQAGNASVAVLEHARLSVDGTGVTGFSGRVDIADIPAHLLVLNGESAVLVAPQALRTPVRLGRTGLAGALTWAAEIDGSAWVLPARDWSRVRAGLHLRRAAVAVGIAGAAYDAAAGYASVRRQFGGPLDALPTVRAALDASADQVATNLAALFGAESATGVVAAAVLRGACEAAVEVATAAVQVHGGYGYLDEYPVARHLRDAISLRATVSDAWRDVPLREAG